ncbi:hypothetical protein [Dactylosporangium sp. CA-139066]|uniref:hypothetical protein n=1 Tax=Dactylosporangium sp. CA-139066 TaxID=3239930 RepID=UPI003D913742
MTAVSAPRRRADEVRTLARRGVLAATVARADRADRARLTGGAYDIAWPVVFNGLTQGLERRRGHLACATSVRHLADDCLDRFEDDVEAVVHDVVRSARKPISNLEAWIASRLNAATVDGHRRRRGDLGALQRPRPPKWLATALGDDPWLVHLAVQMLVWVGQSATAGLELWPVESWTAERAERTGDWAAGRAMVRRDIERVLAAMRRRPDWYAAYVERPLGRKEAPVSRGTVVAVAGADDPMLALVDPADNDDAYMRALAYEAVVAIRGRIAKGVPAAQAVTDVIQLVFGDDGDIAIGRAPRGDAGDERVGRLLRDAGERTRIVAAVLAIIGEPDL